MTRPIVVFGGSGFLGDALVRELVEAGRPTRLVARHPVWPSWAESGDPLALVAADIRHEEEVAAALKGAAAVVNAVSLYVESRDLGFEAIHVEGAGRLARLAREAGIDRLVQLSGIGVEDSSPSAYVRARARGERAVLAAMPRAIIVRPSVLFGPDDAFLGGLARLVRLPAIPLFGRGETRLQPVHVIDAARALARLTGPEAPARRLFELGGGDVLRYREIVELVMARLGRERPLVPVPFWLWRTLAGALAAAGPAADPRPGHPHAARQRGHRRRRYLRRPGAQAALAARGPAGQPGVASPLRPARSGAAGEAQAFLTNADFSFIGPMPSTLQSMSWSPSTRRMPFTLVPTFTTEDEPLTLRSLITVTVSPSASALPLASRTTGASSSASGAASVHS